MRRPSLSACHLLHLRKWHLAVGVIDKDNGAWHMAAAQHRTTEQVNEWEMPEKVCSLSEATFSSVEKRH